MLGKIACIGAGVIGRGWTVVFARAGYQVCLYDRVPGRADIARDFAYNTLLDQCTKIEAKKFIENVSIANSLEEALVGAKHVQENIAENLSAKQSLFRKLDAIAQKDVVLASSTSEIPGSQFLYELDGAHRCVVAHPLNPPFVIPLVEISKTNKTSSDALNRTYSLMEQVGQMPVILKREVSGFLANRLQMALLGEAMHLVADGYCKASDIDRVMKGGLGLRWALLGPFEAGHLNADKGVGEYLSKFKEPMRRIIDSLEVKYPWSDKLISSIHNDLAALMPEEDLPLWRNWRDETLLKIKDVLGTSASEMKKKLGCKL